MLLDNPNIVATREGLGAEIQAKQKQVRLQLRPHVTARCGEVLAGGAMSEDQYGRILRVAGQDRVCTPVNGILNDKLLLSHGE